MAVDILVQYGTLLARVALLKATASLNCVSLFPPPVFITKAIFLAFRTSTIWGDPCKDEWISENILSYLRQAGMITLILNIIMMFIGYYLAKFFASGIAQRKCIALECGLQNGTLAVFVASQLFNEVTFLIPTAAYALIMFVTSLIFVFIIRKTV